MSNKMALDALKFAEAALADIGDADREPGDDLAWCEARAAEALPQTRAAIAALEAEPQDDEPTWQELEDFRKRHWTHWNAADNLLIAHLAQKLKCAARAKE